MPSLTAEKTWSVCRRAANSAAAVLWPGQPAQPRCISLCCRLQHSQPAQETLIERLAFKQTTEAFEAFVQSQRTPEAFVQVGQLLHLECFCPPALATCHNCTALLLQNVVKRLRLLQPGGASSQPAGLSRQPAGAAAAARPARPAGPAKARRKGRAQAVQTSAATDAEQLAQTSAAAEAEQPAPAPAASSPALAAGDGPTASSTLAADDPPVPGRARRGMRETGASTGFSRYLQQDDRGKGRAEDQSVQLGVSQTALWRYRKWIQQLDTEQRAGGLLSQRSQNVQAQLQLAGKTLGNFRQALADLAKNQAKSAPSSARLWERKPSLLAYVRLPDPLAGESLAQALQLRISERSARRYQQDLRQLKHDVEAGTALSPSLIELVQLLQHHKIQVPQLPPLPEVPATAPRQRAAKSAKDWSGKPRGIEQTWSRATAEGANHAPSKASGALCTCLLCS